MGVCSIDQRTVLIVGGMNGSFTRQRQTTKFDTSNNKFTALTEMRVSKIFNGNVFYHEGSVFAIGGNEKDICERYDTYQNRWEGLASYSYISQQKELNTWVQTLSL